jgi:hypothetical protein
MKVDLRCFSAIFFGILGLRYSVFGLGNDSNRGRGILLAAHIENGSEYPTQSFVVKVLLKGSHAFTPSLFNNSPTSSKEVRL